MLVFLRSRKVLQDSERAGRLVGKQLPYRKIKNVKKHNTREPYKDKQHIKKRYRHIKIGNNIKMVPWCCVSIFICYICMYILTC